jgi:hypothetical protein
MTSGQSDLEAKRDDKQTLAEETRELANNLAEMALGMLRASRQQTVTADTSVS